MTKRSPRDLAILGGEAAFPDLLHVGRPNLPARERFLARVEDLLDRRWLTNDGPYVRRLEEELAERTGVPHCVAVCNATVGLLLAMRALELSQTPLLGPGERSDFVSEEFAFEQGLAEGGAIDRHEGSGRPRAVLVDHPRDQFLARPAFSQDQNR